MRIIVYGLGKRGEKFIQDIQDTYGEIEIVAVTDTHLKNVNLKTANNLLSTNLQQIQDFEYDYIIVTPKGFYNEILEQLLVLGIEERKIRWLDEFIESETSFFCNICGAEIFVWETIGEDYEIFHNVKISGAGKRRGGCPVCGSNDRARFVYFVMKKFTKLFDGNMHNILHFAPENVISEKLRTINGKNYVTADIENGRADVVADITNLQFDDNQFEYIICNHVMEHVEAEKKAFLEIRRCLQLEGVLIFTVPICWEYKTYDNEKITTEADRVKYYGQKDHVRLYGNDIVERIEKYGFAVKLLQCKEICNEEEIKQLGFLQDDSVLLCKKRNND